MLFHCGGSGVRTSSIMMRVNSATGTKSGDGRTKTCDRLPQNTPRPVWTIGWNPPATESAYKRRSISRKHPTISSSSNVPYCGRAYNNFQATPRSNLQTGSPHAHVFHRCDSHISISFLFMGDSRYWRPIFVRRETHITIAELNSKLRLLLVLLLYSTIQYQVAIFSLRRCWQNGSQINYVNWTWIYRINM